MRGSSTTGCIAGRGSTCTEPAHEPAGCYVGFTPPGVLLDFGPAIRRPAGRIHWAGAEYATIWDGYMDGAVRSGEDVATTVIGRP